MFDYIQYAYKTCTQKPDDKKPKIVVPLMKQDELRSQLRHTEKKPAAYKNSNASSMNLLDGSYYL
jgi:hypothetical protein